MSEPTEASLSGFFADALDEYTAAAGAAGEVVRTLRVADRELLLRFAGRALSDELLPALAALVVERPSTEKGHATICLWEEDACVGGAIPVPWHADAVGHGGLVGNLTDAPVVMIQAGPLTMYDRRSSALLYRVRAASYLPWWEQAAPLRPAFFHALGGSRRHLVHGGAVGHRARGGTLLAGRGGSGKTTTALAALIGGLDYVADDYLLLDMTDEPVAWNVYGTAKLDDGHRARFPTLATATAPLRSKAADEKAVLDVAKLLPELLVEKLPIRSVTVPRITSGRSAIRRMDATQALRALAPSTVLQLPYDSGSALAVLAELVRSVPCYQLDVGDFPEDLLDDIELAVDA